MLCIFQCNLCSEAYLYVPLLVEHLQRVHETTKNIDEATELIIRDQAEIKKVYYNKMKRYNCYDDINVS